MYMDDVVLALDKNLIQQEDASRFAYRLLRAACREQERHAKGPDALGPIAQTVSDETPKPVENQGTAYVAN